MVATERERLIINNCGVGHSAVLFALPRYARSLNSWIYAGAYAPPFGTFAYRRTSYIPRPLSEIVDGGYENARIPLFCCPRV